MRRSKLGFTLVELLVVITIIAMLAGLLLPAIQSAREAARRAQCINNQGQLASAVTQYESARQKMPGSWAAIYSNPQSGTAFLQPVNWTVMLFPYCGRNDIYNAFKTGSSGSPLSTNVPTVSFLQCPSNPLASVNAGESPLSYVANCGQIDVAASTTVSSDYQENGVFFNQMTYGGTAPATGTNLIVTMTMSYISKWDGTSNTLMLSENLDTPAWYQSSSNSTYACPWDGYAMSSGTTVSEFYGGMVWSLPQTEYALNQNAGLPGSTGTKYARPSSKHPSGFVVAMCDGSAKFLSQDILYQTFVLLMAPHNSLCKTPGGSTLTPYPGNYYIGGSASNGLIPLSDAMLNP